MIRFPEVQKRAQEELDQVVGTGGQLPSIEHRDKLNYVQALTSEILRHANVVPFSRM